MSIFRIAWDRWKIIGHINGDYVGRFTTNAFYYTVFVPFALIAKIFVDPLKLRRTPGWIDRKPISSTLEEARNQF